MSEGISAGAVFIDVLPNMAGFSEKLAAGMESQGLASKTAALGKSLTKSLTLPIVGLAAVSTKWAIDFQREMEMVHTQAGASQAEVTKMSAAVLDLAKSTQQGPDELAQALFHIESVGYRGAKAMDVLKTATKGAAVGGANLEDTASALAAVTLTNIKGTENYNHAMGVLNATIGAGNMRMGDLLEALKSGIVPTAKVAGLSLSGLTAALAMMTDEGVPAGVAANRLRTALLMITNPTEKAQTALQSIGLTSLDLGHALQKPDGLVKALTMLQDHMQGIHDKTKRLALIGTLFGGSRSAGTIALLMNNLDRVKIKYDQINKTASHFNQDVAATQQTAAFKLGKAWSSVQVAMIKVGGALAPLVTQMASAVGKLADAFSGLNTTQQQYVLYALGAAAALGPLLMLTGRLFQGLTLLTQGFAMVGRSVLVLIGLLPGFEVELIAGEGAMIAFGEASTFALGPVGMLAVGIGAVAIAAAAVIGYLWTSSQNTDALRDASNQAAAAVNGLNTALDHSKKAHEAAVAARHQETAAALAVKDAENGVTQALKEGGKGSLAYKKAVNQLAMARDNLYSATVNAQAKEETWRKEQAKGRKELNANRDALSVFTSKVRQHIQALGDNAITARNNGLIEAKNNAVLQSAAKHYGDLAKSYDNQAKQLQATHPALAEQERRLAAQAAATQELIDTLNRIPTMKQVQIQIALDTQAHNMQSRPTAKKRKAWGGPVDANTPYIVGDGGGPEVFVPSSSGHIIPNGKLQQMEKAGSVGALTITNWKEGTGHFTMVAADEDARTETYDASRRRMGR